MNKKIVIACLTYVVLLAGFSGYKISKNEGSYFTYKKDVKAAMANIEKAKAEEKSKVEEAKNITSTPETNSSAPIVPAASTDTTTPKEEDYSGINFTRAIWEGSNGEDVKKLQYILKKKGLYNGDITGQYDKNTTKALVKYQQSKKILPADGVLGASTWNTLKD